MTGWKFDSMPAIEVRNKEDFRNWGREDHPYLVSWYYPVWSGRTCRSERRHKVSTREQALEFAVKHRPPIHRVPDRLRRDLAKLLKTLEELDVTTILRK